MKPTHSKYSAAEEMELFDGMTLKVLLRSSDTNGLQSVFEDIVAPGLGPTRHIHHKQDETFIFIEGSFDVEIDGQLFQMEAGDVAFVPKGTIHGWKNVGDTIGKLRYIFSPALNIEEMFREIHEARQSENVSPETWMKIAQKYPEQENAGDAL